MNRKKKEWGSRKMTEELMARELIPSFQKASKRIFFLDYDGTLAPFAKDPLKAIPSEELKQVLHTLSQLPQTEVVIISGRNQKTLEEWLGDLEIGLVAEHGASMREKNGDWVYTKHAIEDWKPEIRALLTIYCDRLPGSFIEEKEFSLVWHYRAADPEQGSGLAKVLIDELVSFITNMDLQVLRGKKVVEVRLAGINKGIGATHFLDKEKYDFIMAVGDDWTDEDLFHILPPETFSIKVGMSPSLARYTLPNPQATIELLKKIGLTKNVVA